MARLIDRADIKPGMTVYVEHKPEGGYPPYWNLAWDLDGHRIKDVLPDGKITFEVWYVTETGRGQLPESRPDIRFWTDGRPEWRERKGTPWA